MVFLAINTAKPQSFHEKFLKILANCPGKSTQMHRCFRLAQLMSYSRMNHFNEIRVCLFCFHYDCRSCKPSRYKHRTFSWHQFQLFDQFALHSTPLCLLITADPRKQPVKAHHPRCWLIKSEPACNFLPHITILRPNYFLSTRWNWIFSFMLGSVLFL